MNPEVLVWGLLFVVGFGLTYRFSAWALNRDRRFDATASATPVAHPEAAPSGNDRADAMTEGPPPRPMTAMPPPSPRSVETAAPTAPHAAQLPPNIAASVLAALARAQTPTPVDRPQMPVLMPDVRATLAPRDIATAVEAPVGLAPRSNTLAPTVAADADTVITSGPLRVTIQRRGTELRARKVGIETPPLDQRIKNTRARKVLVASKPLSKPATVRDNVEPAIPSKTFMRGSLRRIGLKPKDGNPLASTKAATKIIGMSRPVLRVGPSAAG